MLVVLEKVFCNQLKRGPKDQAQIGAPDFSPALSHS
jgi:hypothetical protein